MEGKGGAQEGQGMVARSKLSNRLSTYDRSYNHFSKERKKSARNRACTKTLKNIEFKATG